MNVFRLAISPAVLVALAAPAAAQDAKGIKFPAGTTEHRELRYGDHKDRNTLEPGPFHEAFLEAVRGSGNPILDRDAMLGAARGGGSFPANVEAGARWNAAFGYLAARYRLRQVPLLGLAPETEPTPRELARLVDTVRRSGASTVFTEPLAPPALADTVARETGAAVVVLDPLEGLTSSERDAGTDYFDVMRPTQLPAFENEFGADGRTYFSVRQTRLGIRGFIPTALGELRTRVDVLGEVHRLEELIAAVRSDTWAEWAEVDGGPVAVAETP